MFIFCVFSCHLHRNLWTTLKWQRNKGSVLFFTTWDISNHRYADDIQLFVTAVHFEPYSSVKLFIKIIKLWLSEVNKNKMAALIWSAPKTYIKKQTSMKSPPCGRMSYALMTPIMNVWASISKWWIKNITERHHNVGGSIIIWGYLSSGGLRGFFGFFLTSQMQTWTVRNPGIQTLFYSFYINLTYFILVSSRSLWFKPNEFFKSDSH